MLSDKNTKIFVLDTNVVLYDFRAIYSFDEHNVVIPITLLEEVDKFKKGHESINYNAREFTRELGDVIGGKLLNKGVRLNNGGFLVVETNVSKEGYLQDVFWEDTADHRILSIAYNLGEKYNKNRVVVISKDINLRMKAKSVGINAEDYETGKVKNLEKLFTGKNLIENVDSALIDKIILKELVSPDEIDPNLNPMPNEFFILKNSGKSVLAKFSKLENSFKVVHKTYAYGIQPRNSEQTFSIDCLLDPNIKLVTLSGKAGTGKTLMALAASLEVSTEYKRIMLARPIVPLSNKDLGYLPGDVKDKINPYMQPLFDNLLVIQDQYKTGSKKHDKINEMLQEEKLMITPLAYIRGRSLSNVFFIVDEAQNLTPHEVKTIITRAGEGTKIVFAGDPYQIDTPYLDSRSNGLSYLIDKMKGQDIFAHVTLERGERSELAELASNLL